MKKILLSSIALLAMVASSCDDNKNDWEKNTMNVQVNSPAVVIPNNGTGEAYFLNDYALRFTQYMEDGKVSVVGITPVALPNGTNFTFQSPATAVTGNQFTVLVNPLAFTTDNGNTVNMSSRFTQQYYSYNPTNSTTNSINQAPIDLTVINVDNEITIKTIQKVMTFAGTTVGLINGSNPFENENVLYEANLDITNRKAEVIIYNAQFAAAMPSIRVMRLKDLTLTPDVMTGYTIKGENIVPEVLEGTNWIPNSNFSFNSFSIIPNSDNLSSASISFKVATIFSGTCLGSYIVQ